VLNINIIAINKISRKQKVWASETRTTHSQTVPKATPIQPIYALDLLVTLPLQ